MCPAPQAAGCLCVGSCDYSCRLNHMFEKNEDIAYLISEQTVYIISLASKFQSNIANSLALIL